MVNLNLDQPDFDPLTPEMRVDPHPFFADMRQYAPMLYVEQYNLWAAFRYAEVFEIFRNHRVFSSDLQRYSTAQSLIAPSMLQTDPPRHTQLRELVSKAFTPRRVAELETRIGQIADGLLDTVTANGHFDVVGDFGYPLPVIVIAEMLGIPSEDLGLFKGWSDEVVETLATHTGTPVDVKPETLAVLNDYFSKIIDQRRVQPRQDLISGLIEAEIDGQRLSLEDMLSFCVLLLVAGNVTTQLLISNTVRCFLEYPDSLAQVLAEPSLLPSAIEEVLRYRAPVMATIRIATERTELAGQTIELGQPVAAWQASANLDETEFPEPERFLITRQPNRHLAFATGIHVCLGAPLARLEARVALARLLNRFQNLRRVDDAPLEPVQAFILHGVKRLPVAFDVREPTKV